MDASANLLAEIQRELDSFLAARAEEFESISPDLSPITEFSTELVRGGKRFRALFCFWSWQGQLHETSSETSDPFTSMVKICAALELFHAAALVHDDLIDQSDTRRGSPAMHKRFEKLHRDSNWSGDSARFGSASSILVGDLMLAWSSELFGTALIDAPSRDVEAACRDEFARMRVEVMAGQYLDVLEENSAIGREVSEAVARANRVMLYKTAKYSIEAPLLIGAAFAGASLAQRRALSSFAIPLGLAFQLRDDILGVFGDPNLTGKPAGDDLREGKRTVLIALTRQSLSQSDASRFDSMLADGALSSTEIEELQVSIRNSGALQQTERMIEELGNECLVALESLEIRHEAKTELRRLANQVMNREN